MISLLLPAKFDLSHDQAPEAASAWAACCSLHEGCTPQGEACCMVCEVVMVYPCQIASIPLYVAVWQARVYTVLLWCTPVHTFFCL
jgi:hypothetical protein